jgi:hypothetical protein
MSVIRIKIESDSIPATVVNPTWPGSVEQSRESDEVYFKKSLSGDFKFKGSEYTLLKDSPECERIEIYLEEMCGGDWVEQWRGHFTTYDCRFNDNSCLAVVKPDLPDIYECFLETIGDDITIYIADVLEVRSVLEVYEGGHSCCILEIALAASTPTDPVCAVPAGYCFDKNFRTDIPTLNKSIIVSCFHRITATGTATEPPPVGSGWTYLSGVTWWRCPDDNEISIGVLSQGRKFNDVLELMATRAGCGFTVRSHFFGLNATHDAPPSNGAYSFATDYTQFLSIHQKSDVKRPDSTDPATSAAWRLTWKKLLDDLKTMFNVYWKLDETTGDMILEHITYFEQTASLDITDQNIVLNYGKGETSAPTKETFKWADDATFSEAHLGYPITYGACGNGTKDHRVALFSNDIDYIRNIDNQSEISDTGFCLISNIVSGGVYVLIDKNAPMGWMMLHDNLHRDYRYFEHGTMNDADDTFSLIRRTRKIDAFKVNVCCSDGFDVTAPITTILGDVTVDKAITNYFSGKENRVVTIEATI